MKYEIEYKIKELLNTIEEALEYVMKLIEEFKYGDVEYLIDDIQDAIDSIENAVIENYIDAEIEEETQKLQKGLKELKKEINNAEITEEICKSLDKVKANYIKWKTKVYDGITPININ